MLLRGEGVDTPILTMGTREPVSPENCKFLIKRCKSTCNFVQD